MSEPEQLHLLPARSEAKLRVARRLRQETCHEPQVDSAAARGRQLEVLIQFAARRTKRPSAAWLKALAAGMDSRPEPNCGKVENRPFHQRNIRAH